MMNPEQTFFNKVHIGNRKDVERIGYDSRLLAAIQPAGGIRFHPAYIRTGSNYGAILTIYDWKSELDAHWLSPLVNQNNLIVSADFGAADAREVKRLIDRSFTEQKIRFQTENKDGEQMDAGRRYQELKELRDAVANQGETLRFVTIRLYVSAKRLEKLEERVTKIQSAVETAEYHCTVLLHEQKQEWQSLLLPYKRQQNCRMHETVRFFPAVQSVTGIHLTSPTFLIRTVAIWDQLLQWEALISICLQRQKTIILQCTGLWCNGKWQINAFKKIDRGAGTIRRLYSHTGSVRRVSAIGGSTWRKISVP